MKKIFKLMGALLAGLAMFACNDQIDETISFSTEITVNVTELEQFAAENATEQTIEVTADGQWMAIAPAWVEIKPNVGFAGTTTVTVKALDNKETVENEAGEMVTELGPQRSATIAFTGEGEAKAEVALTQAGDPNKWDPAKPRPVTMQYFNETATTGDGFIYELTGTITEVVNTQYGNFYFTDETGTAYVYGLLTPEGEAQKQWAAAGLKLNDVITVRGARGEYKGSPQMSNATYVSHEVGEESPIKDATIAEFLAAEVGGTQYRISGAVTSIAKAEYGNVYIKDATGEVYVYGIGQKGEFETMGIEVGDIITLISNRGEYKETPQAANSTLDKKVDVTPLDNIAAFLATEQNDTYYMISGTVSGMDGAGDFGNIYVEDETGKVYVYGLLSGWNGAKKEFPALVEATGLKDGDVLTLIGKHTSYKDVDQVGSAFYFSHEEGAVITTVFGDGTKAFLQAIVDGNMQGESTPTVADWNNFNAEFPGITIAEVDGKLEVTSINTNTFVELPSVIDLPCLTYFHLNGSDMTGKAFPATWNTPKLEYVNIAVCKFAGVLPASFAENTPAMHTLFMNDNQFEGAWPHFWASGVNGGSGKLECVIAVPGNDKMGYLVPATLDVKVNSYGADGNHNNPSRDKTQIKLGGAEANPAQYLGFEKGWGQQRYVAYAGGAENDLTTWHEKRGLAGNPDHWAWFFTNLPGTIPTVLLTWDQAAADSFTASGVLPEPEPEVLIGEGTKAFLKAIVDGNMMGESTPTVADWNNFDATFPGITIAEVDGKLEVTSINTNTFVELPSAIDLPYLTYFHLNGSDMTGKAFPATWNTPKLEYVNIAVCKFAGVLPASFAENTPAMHTLFMNDNQFEGAWPHFWASGVNGGSGKLECVIAVPGNDKMGYMVPATLDVKLNNYVDGVVSNPSRDKTQIKLGGADANPAQYVGFEKGWGQERYVKYGEGAADDLTTWNAHRLLTENGDEWAWFFSNLPGSIPTVLLDWDQAAADSFTASGVLPDLSQPEEGGVHEGFN